MISFRFFFKVENEIEDHFNTFKNTYYYAKQSLEVKQSFEDKLISEIDFSRMNENEYLDVFQRLRKIALEEVCKIFDCFLYYEKYFIQNE